jgi:hypothetical protein
MKGILPYGAHFIEPLIQRDKYRSKIQSTYEVMCISKLLTREIEKSSSILGKNIKNSVSHLTTLC